MDQIRILILSNDLVGQDELCEELRKSSLDVRATYEPREALRWTLDHKFDLAILGLDYLAAKETAKAIRDRNPGTLLIVLSGAPRATSTISMVEELGGAVVRDRMISHRELRDLVVELVNPGGSRGSCDTVHRL